MITDATKEVLAEVARIPAMLAAHFTYKYGKLQFVDLPGNYLNWFAREGFPSGEIGRLLALMQEKDHNGLRPLLNPLREKRL